MVVDCRCTWTEPAKKVVIYTNTNSTEEGSVLKRGCMVPNVVTIGQQQFKVLCSDRLVTIDLHHIYIVALGLTLVFSYCI